MSGSISRTGGNSSNMRDFLKKWKRYFVFAGLLSCFINILQLTFAFYMFVIYRSIVVSEHEKSLYTVTVLALYALLCLVFFSYLRIRLLAAAGVDLNRGSAETVFKNILKGQALPGGRGYAQGMGDMEALRGYFTNPAIYALFDAPWAPLYLLLIFFFHPVLGLVATAGAAAVFVLGFVQNLLTRGRLAEANLRHGRNRRFVDKILRNSETVNALGMRGNVSRRWDEENESVIRNQTAASRHAGLIQSITRPAQMLTQVMVYGIGAYFVMTGSLEVGLMVASAIIMGQAVGPVMQAMGSWRFTVQARDAYRRLSAFLDRVEAAPAKMSLPGPEGRIEADHLFLSISGTRLLENVSFSLFPGEVLGIVGHSGAGKSTLCRVILGLWPSAGGGVRLDGVDLFYWNQEELGRHMGYLPQEVELFDGTVAENIARMDTPDPEMVKTAARMAGIYMWMKSLPEGPETRLYSQGGISPSGGQRQRVGLARALYGGPRVLVLDEPDSNLDEAGRSSLAELLGAIRKDRSSTCLVVSHDRDILGAADRILVLSGGRAAALGPAAEVLDRMTAGDRRAV